MEYSSEYSSKFRAQFNARLNAKFCSRLAEAIKRVFMLSALSSQALYAQPEPPLLTETTQTTQTTATAQTSATAQISTNTIEEIVVFAEKRARDLQNVDITVSVISESTSKGLGMQSLQETIALVENVELFEDFSGAGIPTWIIRGVGLQDFNSNNTPAAAVYLDEAYQTSTVMGALGLFDYSQIEVLKGPQGGLYGRNTSGGAVLLNTRRAELDTRSAYVSLGYDRWQTSTVEAAVNIPLTQTTALRLSGRSQSSTDGWQKSLSTGETHGEKENWDMRSWFLYQPNEKFKAQWKIQGGENNNDIPLGRSVGLYDKQAIGAFCSSIVQGSRDDLNCINFADVNLLSQNPDAEPSVIGAQSRDGRQVFSDTINKMESDYLSSVLSLSWQLPSTEFVSISSVDHFNYGVALDLDGSAGEFGHRFSSSDIKNYAQEFRLLSRDATRLSWLVGAVFSDEEFSENRDFKLRENVLVGLGVGKLAYQQSTRSRAIYADIDYDLMNDWSLSASLRYTSEEKEYRNGDFYIPITPPFYFVQNLSADYSLDKNMSGKVGLKWRADDDLMLYTSISKGFKSGGFFGGFPFNPEEIMPYLEETIVAYEAGFKSDHLDNRLKLNGAAFYYDYSDVQGFVTDLNPITGTSIDRLTNQGDANHKGIELQLSWLLRNNLSIDAGLGYLDARFTSSTQESLNIEHELVFASGKRPYAPRWNSNILISYEAFANNNYSLKTMLNYHYRSNLSAFDSSQVGQAVNNLSGYGIVNMGFGLDSADSKWKLSMWIKNIFDKSYRTRIKNDGLNSYIDLFGEPRNIGLVLEYTL